MAGGDTPRQKMINLMYLVFIAMLALNMSKEVLGAFGIMNTKAEKLNTTLSQKNDLAYAGLATQAGENAEKFGKANESAMAIKELSAELNTYIEGLKSGMLEKVEDKEDFVAMDQADYLDQKFFQADGKSADGKEFVDKVNDYRTKVAAVLDSFPEIKAAVMERFSTGDDKGKITRKRDNIKVDWLDYNFKGYPLVASLTKFTSMQSDIKATEDEVLSTMLNTQLAAEASYDNYTTILDQPKSAYYQGETFNGSLLLGRADSSTKPDRAELTLDGRKLVLDKDYTYEGGGVKFKMSAGAAGDHQIKGKLIFKQKGEEIEVPVERGFATITKPNAAVISADKMNVVYRGVTNPMTISIPGIPDNKVRASAPGLSRNKGSKYFMRPRKGREVRITATGTMPDGTAIKTTSKFRIKDIPRPIATIRGEGGTVKMPRSALGKSTVGAMLEDFDFDIKLNVSSFKFKVPGQPTITVRGKRLDSRAKSALKRAKRGDVLQIIDVKASISGNSGYRLKKVSPVLMELTN